MIQTIEFRPAARTEFDEAADWYEEQQAGLRETFILAVAATIERIKATPLAFPIVEGSNVRRAVVNRFPYSIFYSANDDLILVFAVFHSSRNPLIWQGRID